MVLAHANMGLLMAVYSFYFITFSRYFSLLVVVQVFFLLIFFLSLRLGVRFAFGRNQLYITSLA